MKHNDFNTIIESLKSVRPSAESKAAVRARFVTARENNRTVRSPYFSFAFEMSARLLVLAVVVVLGGAGMTVTTAAENTVPGDFLYPVKVKINEEVREFFTPSLEGKMRLQEERLSRRIKEAEELASMGQLNEERKLVLKNNIEKHLTTSVVLEAKKEELSLLLLEVEGKLRAYQEVLDALETEEEKDVDKEEKGDKEAEETKEPTPVEGDQAIEDVEGGTEEESPEEALMTFEAENVELVEEESSDEGSEQLQQTLADRVEEAVGEERNTADEEVTLEDFVLVAERNIEEIYKTIDLIPLKDSSIDKIDRRLVKLADLLTGIEEKRAKGTREEVIREDLAEVIKLSKEIQALISIQQHIELPDISLLEEVAEVVV